MTKHGTYDNIIRLSMLASSTKPRTINNISDGDLLQVSDAFYSSVTGRLIIHIVLAVDRLCDLI